MSSWYKRAGVVINERTVSQRLTNERSQLCLTLGKKSEDGWILFSNLRLLGVTDRFLSFMAG